VADFLSGCGAEVSLREVLPGRPNVVGRFPSRRAGGRRILLAPHLDTVSVAGMTIDPFGGAVREGHLFGRGASDTKGTAAAMLWALREAKDFLADSA
jgi:acetylornithine deacetylase